MDVLGIQGQVPLVQKHKSRMQPVNSEASVVMLRVMSHGMGPGRIGSDGSQPPESGQLALELWASG